MPVAIVTSRKARSRFLVERGDHATYPASVTVTFPADRSYILQYKLGCGEKERSSTASSVPRSKGSAGVRLSGCVR